MICREITSVLQFLLWFLCPKHCPEGPINALRNCLMRDSDLSVQKKNLKEERNETAEGQREIEELTTGLARAELALEDARDPEPR